jgi:hypothetical protein
MRVKTLAALAALSFSAAVVVLPAVASAAPATQTYDIWNLTSSAVTVAGYDKPPSYKMVPQSDLPKDTVIPIGKNLQITVSEGYGVIVRLSGSQQAQQGGAQSWQVSTELESSSEWLPAPIVHMACVPGDPKNSACGVSVGSNVKSIADGPGTKITVPADDKQKQSEIRSSLCDHPYRKQLQIDCHNVASTMQVTAGNTIWTLVNFR